MRARALLTILGLQFLHLTVPHPAAPPTLSSLPAMPPPPFSGDGSASSGKGRRGQAGGGAVPSAPPPASAARRCRAALWPLLLLGAGVFFARDTLDYFTRNVLFCRLTPDAGSPSPLIEIRHQDGQPLPAAVATTQVPLVVRGLFAEEVRGGAMDRVLAAFGSRTVVTTGRADSSGRGGVNVPLNAFWTEPAHGNDAVINMQGLGSGEEYAGVLGEKYWDIAGMPSHWHAGGQFFFARGQHSGSPLHMAWGRNVFVQLHGMKRWVIVHPRHAALLGCYLSGWPLTKYLPPNASKVLQKWMGGFPGSQGACLRSGQMNFQTGHWPPGVNFSHMRADAFLDRFMVPGLLSPSDVVDVTLRPGDVLVNPDLWFHTIENLSPATSAFSFRHGDLQAGGFLSNPHKWWYGAMALQRSLISKLMASFDPSAQRPWTALDVMWHAFWRPSYRLFDEHPDFRGSPWVVGARHDSGKGGDASSKRSHEL